MGATTLMTTTSDTTGQSRINHTPKREHDELQIQSLAGALALIDILFEMGAINKATYDAIKHGANDTLLS